MKQFTHFICIIFASFLLTAPHALAQARQGQDQIGRNVTAQSFGNDNLWHLRQAEIYIKQMNVEKALFELDLAVAQDPYHADAYLRRAMLKNRIGMRTEAQRDLQTALRLNPYVADLYGYNGPMSQINLLSTQWEIELAPQDQTNTLQTYYDILDQWGARQRSGMDFVYPSSTLDLELDYLEAAIMDIEAEEWEAALSDIDKALALNPQSPIAHDLRGLTLLKTGRLEEAETSILNALDEAPGFAQAWCNLSQVYRAQGRAEDAVASLNRAIALQEDLAAAYYDRAQLEGGQQAIDDYDAAIAFLPEPFMQGYLNRGLTRKMLGDFGGALADFDRVIEIEGPTPELLQVRGGLYLVYGLYNKALLDYTNAIQQNPDLPEIWYNRGIAHLLNGDGISACHDLRKSAEMGFDKAAEKVRYFCVY